MSYGITVHQMAIRAGQHVRIDLAHYTTADTAPEMEDLVTALHREYPAPHFQVEVRTHRRTHH